MTLIKTKTDIDANCILNASILYCSKKLRQYVKKIQMTIKTDVRTN